jgi:hypothetical protein
MISIKKNNMCLQIHSFKYLEDVHGPGSQVWLRYWLRVRGALGGMINSVTACVDSIYLA